MERLVRRPERVIGSISPPPDKSISHRALMLNSIARGTAHIANLSHGGDVLSTLRCLRALGARIRLASNGLEGKQCVVEGRGLYGLAEASNVLDAGNSGTTTRFMAGILAAQPFLSVLTGDRSLRSRPMGRVIAPLKMMGAQIWGRANDTLAPFSIKGGRLRGIEYSMPVASAQVKSALLLAGLYAEGTTILQQPALSRDHTERMLRAMGADLTENGLILSIRPGELNAVDINVPADLSSAAYWLVAAVCHPSAELRLTGVGLNPGRTGILDALSQMGARISIEDRRQEGNEPVGDLVARSSSLKGVEIGGDMIPCIQDELPLLAVAACFAEGTTVVRDAEELRVKESDRIKTTVTELSRLGARIQELSDGFVVQGTGHLRGATCFSYGDHRLTMSLAVAGLLADGETVVKDAEAASVTYPGFWDDLQSLTLGNGTS